MRTHRPGGAPSSAICRVFITLNGYKHVVRPCAAHICSAVGPLQECIKQATLAGEHIQGAYRKERCPNNQELCLI